MVLDVAMFHTEVSEGTGGEIVVAMAAPGPLESTMVTAPDGNIIVEATPTLTPTVQVPPQKSTGNLSRHDLIMLFSREVPLAQRKPVPEGAALAWAETTNSLLKSAVTEVIPVTATVTSKVESLFHQLLPQGSDGGVKYRASATIQKKLVLLDLSNLMADSGDDLAEVFGQHVTFQLVSTKIDPKTKKVAVSLEVPILNWVLTRNTIVPTSFHFNLDFQVAKDFGTPGAIVVKNRHLHEFLLVSFAVQTSDSKIINFPADSWVYNTNFGGGRVFFSNDMYLPKNTPEGLVALRQQELEDLRGNGEGERKYEDRIYDYATYNDLGNPDSNSALKRPVLGGSTELPYPRRCRTGRPPTKEDPTSESRGENLLALFYIPRDERFNQVKSSGFAADEVRSVKHSLVAQLKNALRDHDQDFDSLGDIDSLYVTEDRPVAAPFNLIPPNASPTSPVAKTSGYDPAANEPPTFIHEDLFPAGPDTSFFYFPMPQLIAADHQAWSQDTEFGRQMLAGLNPIIITLVQEFPIKSTLDPAQYGDPISAITAEHLAPGLEGLTVDQALKEKRLFTQDYHDVILLYADKINSQGKGCIYAPRTVVCLTSENILTPVAIELVLPPKYIGGKKRSRVFTPPPSNSSKDWVWELAKVHVASVDCSYHEVISHFLRTHASIEPFIIATNRQLSVLHPINQVLVPHYKNTLDINASARKTLNNAGGVIENNFTPGKFIMEMSAVVYKLDWRFDEQALPNDLLKRGMAVPDPSAPHGLKLVIQDYPYAADGLELWAALKDYMTDHVTIFYKSDKDVLQDSELQNWWTEVRTVGHGDKKDSPGWPNLTTIDALVFTLTTIAWVASCHHAAVNFGQYAYGGYMPNHPSMMRKFIPEPGTPEWEQLHKNPERFYLDSISNVSQATSVMSTIELLSTHALDEEYLGQRLTPNWSNDAQVLAAFAKFSETTKAVEATIHERNADPRLKNRSGPAKLPYELLVPTSGPGMTGKGVPNSVSI